MARLDDLKKFYGLMENLEKNSGRKHTLGDCDRDTVKSTSGVYFFFEDGEVRTKSGNGDRVVRVGESSNLYDRICRKHRGPADRIGRGVFRKWVHNAQFRKYREAEFSDWPDISEKRSLQGIIGALNDEQRRLLGRYTSEHMWQKQVLFVPVHEEDRFYIEKNAIKLLSEYRKDPIDPPSCQWLGHHSCSCKIRLSGLWNSDHVSNCHDPDFLNLLEDYVDEANA